MLLLYQESRSYLYKEFQCGRNWIWHEKSLAQPLLWVFYIGQESVDGMVFAYGGETVIIFWTYT